MRPIAVISEIAAGLAFIMLVGCSSGEVPAAAKGRPGTLRPDCTGAQTMTSGVCVRFFDTPGWDSEASVAAHPTDSRMLALSWQAPDGNGARHIHVAVTADAGRRWTVTQLEPPLLNQGSPATQRADEVDSTVVIARDGAVQVAFLDNGRDIAPSPGLEFYAVARLVVATSRDHGASWTYTRIGGSLDTLTPDYPDLAIAPDTGELYLVAQNVAHVAQPIQPVLNCLMAAFCPAPERITVWKSMDGGMTWSEPSATQGFFTVPGFFPRSPRIIAGPDGLVIVTVKASPYHPSALQVVAGFAVVSRDGGFTWSAPQPIHPSAPEPFLVKPIALVAGHDGSHRLHAVYPNGTEIVGYRHTGTDWEGPYPLFTFPPDSFDAFLAAAGGPRGDVYAQFRYGGADRFAAGLTRWHTDGTFETLTLVDLPGVAGEWRQYDDYGAIAVAADGSIWTAWSDPRGEKAEAVALAHIVPTPRN